MAIYIEVIILDNFIIDYIILRICGMKQRRKCVWWRLSLASVWGVAIAFVALLEIGDIAMLSLKVLASFLMVLVAFGKSSFWKMLFDFYFFTFAIGGCAMGILYLKEGVNFGITSKLSSVPTGIIFGAVFGGYILTMRCIHIFSGKAVKNQFSYLVEVRNDCMSRLIFGFLDTGNLLTFSNDLRGVCICEYRKMASVFKGKKPRGQVMLATANGENMLNVYIADAVKIYDIAGDKGKRNKKGNLVLAVENLPIALSKTAMFDDFEILLSPRLFY